MTCPGMRAPDPVGAPQRSLIIVAAVALAAAAVMLFAGGCRTGHDSQPRVPYPVTIMVDPVTERAPDVIREP